MENAQKTSAIVKEIAAASKEQSIGVNQVNSSVTELDKVTQSNAAVAEESSAASDELRVQGANVEQVIAEMEKIIFGENTTKQFKAMPSASTFKPSKALPKRKSVVSQNGSSIKHQDSGFLM